MHPTLWTVIKVVLNFIAKLNTQQWDQMRIAITSEYVEIALFLYNKTTVT